TARKIRQPIETSDDIVNAFDGITYAKGMAVLQMFESFISEQSFQRGLQRYLREHAHKNATATDFIAALAAELRQSEAPPVAAAAGVGRRADLLPAALQSFLEQPGVPLLSLKLACDKGPPTLSVTQERYLPLGAAVAPAAAGPAPVYKVPVCI